MSRTRTDMSGTADGSNGTCGSPQGFRPTTFSDGSADKTYCLSVAD